MKNTPNHLRNKTQKSEDLKLKKQLTEFVKDLKKKGKKHKCSHIHHDNSTCSENHSHTDGSFKSETLI